MLISRVHYEQLVTKMRIRCGISITTLYCPFRGCVLCKNRECSKAHSLTLHPNTHWQSFVYGSEMSYPIPFHRQKQLSKSALTMDLSAALFKSQHPCQVRIRLPTLALKPRGDVTRSPKQGYQWPHKKDLCPPNFLLKKSLNSNCE